jgi:hypothetical protein
VGVRYVNDGEPQKNEFEKKTGAEAIETGTVSLEQQDLRES